MGMFGAGTGKFAAGGQNKGGQHPSINDKNTDQSPGINRRKKEVLGDFTMFRLNKEFENFWSMIDWHKEKRVTVSEVSFSVSVVLLTLSTNMICFSWGLNGYHYINKRSGIIITLRHLLKCQVRLSFIQSCQRNLNKDQASVQSLGKRRGSFILPLLTTTNKYQWISYMTLFLNFYMVICHFH